MYWYVAGIKRVNNFLWPVSLPVSVANYLAREDGFKGKSSIVIDCMKKSIKNTAAFQGLQWGAVTGTRSQTRSVLWVCYYAETLKPISRGGETTSHGHNGSPALSNGRWMKGFSGKHNGDYTAAIRAWKEPCCPAELLKWDRIKEPCLFHSMRPIEAGHYRWYYRGIAVIITICKVQRCW